ncbi:hypothetical protein LTS17_005438 [Exophiala oligosperma]
MSQITRTDSTEVSCEYRHAAHNNDGHGDGDSQGMLNSYIYTTSTTVLDFILLGRRSTRSYSRSHARILDAMMTMQPQHLRQHSRPLDDDTNDTNRHQIGRCTNVSELMTFMDRITDAKIVREAIVFRPLLVDRDY